MSSVSPTSVPRGTSVSGPLSPPDQTTSKAGEDLGRLAMLAVGTMLAMTTWFSTSAVLPELRDRWELSTNQASILIVVLQLGFVAGAVVSAVAGLADRLRLRWFIAGSALAAAAANALVIPLDGYEPAVILRFLTGAFLAGVYPPGLKLIATWFRRSRGMAMGVMIAALTVGSAAPHLVNGLGGADRSTVMYTTSLITVVGAAVIMVAGMEGPYPFPRTPFRVSQVPRVMGDRAVALASAGYFGHMWELYAMWAWIAAFLADAADRTGTSTTPPVLAFAAIAIGAVGAIGAGLAGDRVGKRRSAMSVMVASGTAALVVGWSGLPFWLVVVVVLVWGLTVVADSAQFSAIVSERADQAYVGTALTMQLAIGFLLTVATIWLVPMVRDSLGWWWAFAMLAPGPFLGALALRYIDS